MKQFFIIKSFVRCDLILEVLHVTKNVDLRIGEIYYLARNWS